MPTSKTYGAYTVTSMTMDGFLHFGSGFLNEYANLNSNSGDPVNLRNNSSSLTVLGVSFQNVGQTIDQMEAVANSNTSDEDEKVAVDGQALCYPNPFRQSSGGLIGYRLTNNGDIQIQVYDMLANMLIKQDFKSGSKGAQKGYNKVQVNLDTWNGFVLSAGVYFYYIIHDGKVLSKGKMAVIP